MEPVFGREVHKVGAGERLDLDFVILPGQSQDLRFEIDLVGEGAEANLRGLYLCPSDERVNITVVLHHRVPGCRSSQLFKGIVGGTASVRFDGTIIVAPEAQKTEAYQENHSILLTESALIETSPQLEIYADDVKCSHGATAIYLLLLYFQWPYQHTLFRSNDSRHKCLLRKKHKRMV